MSKLPRHVIVQIFKEIEPLLAQINGLSLNVKDKTWTRWDAGRNTPSPQLVAEVARGIWNDIHKPAAESIRGSVLTVFERAFSREQIISWRTAEECGAAFYRLAENGNGSATPSGLNTKRDSTRRPADRLNPFTWLDAIDEPDFFFGREKELRSLRGFLNTRSSVQIVGPRRMGKSSLLFAVGHHLAEWFDGTAFAFVDMEKANHQTIKGWFRRVALEWNWPEAPQSIADFSDRVDADLRAKRRLILGLDECEKFKDLTAEFTTDFFENLRGCGQAGVSILTAARMSLREIRRSGALLSPYYNTFARLDLEPFAEKEALGFVSRSRPNVPKFTDKEVDAILQSAEGHPLRLVFACYEVLEARWNGEALVDAIRRGERRADELLPSPV